jgi:hyperpolarization activated cyclic nucleotide-gated potassium channel 1
MLGKSWGLEVFSIFYLLIMLYLQMADSLYKYESLKYGMIVFAVQSRNVTKMMRQFEEVLNLSKIQSSVLELAKLILTVMFVLHLFSCLWFWCGNYSQNTWGDSWLSHKDLLLADPLSQYLYSFYYSTVTMFTVGYGDITP